MDAVLTQCNRNFGRRPREFSWWELNVALRYPRPGWLRWPSRDKLKELFRHQRNLFAQGVVVWGHVIQANSLLFHWGFGNCPGEVVYTLHDVQGQTPEYLQQLASRIAALKRTRPGDSEQAFVAEYLADEMTRVFGVPVPEPLSPHVPCFISTTYFVRNHLPKRRLGAMLVPVLVNPTQPRHVVPLPCKFWPDPLLDFWTQ